MAEPTKTCTYPDCTKKVNTPHDDEHCIFHAPVDKKGVSGEEFCALMSEQFKREDYDCGGYIFPVGITFEEEELKKDAFFNNAQFFGYADFQKVQFSGDADFREARFSEPVNFTKALFSGPVNFTKALFCKYSHFKEARFSAKADFGQAQFSESSGFEKAKFSGFADFRRVKFDFADFKKAQFSGIAFFPGAQFSIGNFQETKFRSARFNYTQFSVFADFQKARFSHADFYEAQLSGADFREAQLSCVDFQEAQFSGFANFSKAQFFLEEKFKRSNSFIQTRFLDKVDFSGSEFDGYTEFWKTEFKGQVLLTQISFLNTVKFIDIKLTADAVFRFTQNKFTQKEEKPLFVFFDQIMFNGDHSLFENIEDKNNSGVKLIFRHCNLRDVYFSHNDMALFSFYKSSFDQARFIANSWREERYKFIPVVKRKNILLEEILYREVQKKSGKEKRDFIKQNSLEHMDSYEIIASLYRRMKTALDGTKDYTAASWFYYNEFEMKRLALQERFKKISFFKGIFQRLHFGLYSLYKLFVGYGEKPLRSFLWFLLFALVVFPAGHILNGLQIKDKAFNYDIDFSNFAILLQSSFWSDFFYAVGFSLYRVIPIGYLPFERTAILPDGPEGLILSFVNSAVLILLAVFTGVGLKRHFRRF